MKILWISVLYALIYIGLGDISFGAVSGVSYISDVLGIKIANVGAVSGVSWWANVTKRIKIASYLIAVL